MLPSEIASADVNYVELQTVFTGNDNYLNTDPGATFFALPGVPEPSGGTILGDANQDGVVDFGDIQPFIGILSAGGFLEEVDVNQDGTVDFSDIQPFIAILSGS